MKSAREEIEAFVSSLDGIVRLFTRLESEVRDAESFLEELYRKTGDDYIARLLRLRLERIRKDWPEFFKD